MLYKLTSLFWHCFACLNRKRESQEEAFEAAERARLEEEFTRKNELMRAEAATAAGLQRAKERALPAAGAPTGPPPAVLAAAAGAVDAGASLAAQARAMAAEDSAPAAAAAAPAEAPAAQQQQQAPPPQQQPEEVKGPALESLEAELEKRRKGQEAAAKDSA